MADKICRKLVGTIKDDLIKIDKFSFPIDFMVLDIKEDPKIALIIGRPFMKTTRMLMDVDTSQVEVRIKNHEVCFMVIGIMKQ